MPAFDIQRFFRATRHNGHGARLGLQYRAHGADWAELAVPFDADLVDDRGALAGGPITAMLDVAASLAVWGRRDAFVAHATLDLRIDQLRAVTPARDVIGHGECYRLSGDVAFVRGWAHDGDPQDPVAQMSGTYMNMVARP